LEFQPYTGRAKKVTLRKIFYISVADIFTKFLDFTDEDIQSTYPANFIKITNTVPQIQQFELSLVAA